MKKEEKFKDISANLADTIFPPKESLKISQKHSIKNTHLKLHQGLCKSNKVKFIDEFLSAYKEEVRVKKQNKLTAHFFHYAANDI
jgi:hypothetical protein